MAKISDNYEVVYIIDPNQGEEAIAATVEKFKALAEQHSSAVEVEEWGKRLQDRGVLCPDELHQQP